MQGQLNPECEITNGQCQHVAWDSKKGAWTIPSGIHTFMARTVSVNGSTAIPVISHPSEDVKQEADNLAKDILQIVADSSMGIGKDEAGNQRAEVFVVEMIQKFCIYLVARDHKILEHGIKLGRSQK